MLNNDNSSASSFRIAILLIDAANYDPSDQSTFHEIASIDDLDGQSGNTVVTYSNVYFDINNTPNIPGGDYIVLVCADQDEANNCIYITTLGNDITYIPNSSSIDNDSKNEIELLTFPNPVKDVLNFASTSKIQGEIEIYDVLGVLVYSNRVDDDHITADTKRF